MKTKMTLAALLAGVTLLGVCSLNAQVNQKRQATTSKTTTAVQEHAHNEPPLPTNSVAVLSPTKGQDVHGVIALNQAANGVEIIGEITGLTPGKHGFHIHEFGDLRSDDGSSAGGHFNPDMHPHGSPQDPRHHAGDLGNITADQNGKAMVKMTMPGLRVHFIIGRSIVVHGKADDLKSQPAGDAGPRVAVGVIGIAGKSAGSTTVAPASAGAKKTKS
jgi:Cu-Zn family superoxide dismutase